jgi:hypothetical protein
VPDSTQSSTTSLPCKQSPQAAATLSLSSAVFSLQRLLLHTDAGLVCAAAAAAPADRAAERPPRLQPTGHRGRAVRVHRAGTPGPHRPQSQHTRQVRPGPAAAAALAGTHAPRETAPVREDDDATPGCAVEMRTQVHRKEHLYPPVVSCSHERDGGFHAEEHGALVELPFEEEQGQSVGVDGLTRSDHSVSIALQTESDRGVLLELQCGAYTGLAGKGR